MKTGKGDGMLTRKEAAEYLKCSISFLNKLAVNNPQSLPFLKLGKNTYYRTEDLTHYRQSRFIGTGK